MLDAYQQGREVRNLLVAQARFHRLVPGDLDLLRPAGHTHDPARFAGDVRSAQGTRSLVNLEVIHFPLAADDRFAEAEVGVHHHLPRIAGHRINTEPDARRFALDHLLDHDSHLGLLMIEVLLLAIRHRPDRPERQKARLDLFQNLIGTGTIEAGVVLAGERRAGQVLHRRGRPDREGSISGIALEH